MITFFDSTFIMLAHGFTAFYVSVYLIGKYGNFNSVSLFKEFVITVVVISGICTCLAVVGIWQKDRPEFFNICSDREESVHFDNIYAFIII